MFISAENWQAPQLTPRVPSRGVASFWEGLGAGFRAEARETDAWSLRARQERDVQGELRDAVRQALGDDEYSRLLSENAPRREQPTRQNQREMRILLDLAPQLATDNPELFRGIPTTREGLQEATQERYQTEYRDAVETMGMNETLPGLAEFLGRGAASITDPVSLALGLVSGGSGTFARVLAREAALGAFGEAAILPRQYRMADYLNIDDPNPVAQVAMGAAFAGAIFGGGKLATRAGRNQISAELARALEYARARTQTVPEYAPDTSVQTQATIDATEEAILERDDIFDPIPRPVADLPEVAPPVRTVAPPVRTVTPEPEPFDDPIETALMQEIEALRREVGRRTRPLSSFLMDRRRDERLPGGGIRTMQIRPGSRAAGELASMGVTPRSRPGLFSRNGRGDFDTLIADEMEDDFPGIKDAAGVSDDGNYLNQDGFLRLLADELTGVPSRLRDPVNLREAEARLQEYLRLRDTADDPITPVEFGNDPVQIAADYERVTTRVNEALHGRGIHDMLTAEDRETITNVIAQYGGTVDHALDEIDRADLKRQRQIDGQPDDVPWDDAYDAAELPRGAGGPEAPEPVARGAEDPGAAGQADRGPRTEQTSAGEQALIPGVEPITQRQRLEQAQARPLGGAVRGADSEIGGLFDPFDKARMDLFSEPQGKPLEDANIAAARDMREWIEANDDFEVTMLNDAGKPVTLRASEWLSDLDDDAALVREAGICRIGGKTNELS